MSVFYWIDRDCGYALSGEIDKTARSPASPTRSTSSSSRRRRVICLTAAAYACERTLSGVWRIAGVTAWKTSNKHALPTGGRMAGARLRALQVEELYRFAPTAAGFSYFGALLTLGVLIEIGDIGRGAVWFLWATAVTFFRFVTIVAYRRRSPAPTRDAWARLVIAANFLAGVQWGILGTLLFPADPRGTAALHPDGDHLLRRRLAHARTRRCAARTRRCRSRPRCPRRSTSSSCRRDALVRRRDRALLLLRDRLLRAQAEPAHRSRFRLRDRARLRCSDSRSRRSARRARASLETKLRSAGLPMEDLPGPPIFSARHGADGARQARPAACLWRHPGREDGPAPPRSRHDAGDLPDAARRARAGRGVPSDPGTIQWDFADAEPVAPVSSRMATRAWSPAASRPPTVTIECRYEDWADLLGGREHPLKLAATRRLRPKGDLKWLWRGAAHIPLVRSPLAYSAACRSEGTWSAARRSCSSG